MEKSEIHAFMRQSGTAILASVSPDIRPEAALVEVAVTPDLEIVFDTLDTTRKCTNLRRNPQIAFVFPGHGPQTLQYEGVAEEPIGEELRTVKAAYFSACTAGLNREGWPGITYFRVRPRWIRVSNYYRPRSIEEMEFPLSDGKMRDAEKRASFLSSLFRKR